MGRKVSDNVGKPSPKWAFFTYYGIKDTTSEDIYLHRWRLISTPLIGIFLHHIMIPDNDRAPHDHPWNFLSLILKGGYTEEVYEDKEFVTGPLVVDDKVVENRERETLRIVRERRRKPGRIHFRRCTDLHRVTFDREAGETCWTLLIHFRRKREWGFSPGPGEWVPWKQWNSEKYGDPVHAVARPGKR